MKELLGIQNASVKYGGVLAVDAVSLSVSPGEQVAVIGPNGAGKTTLLNMVTGVVWPDSGMVRFNSIDISGWRADRIAQAGVLRSFQIARLFDGLSVLDNLVAAAVAGTRSVRGLSSSRTSALSLLQEIGMADRSNVYAGQLSSGDRKQLEIAMLVIRGPRLMILDEPTAGVGPDERSLLMSWVFDTARRRGTTILFTEHDMDVVFEFASRICVMSRGSVIAIGSPDEISQDPSVREVYFGAA